MGELVEVAGAGALKGDSTANDIELKGPLQSKNCRNNDPQIPRMF